jgi:Na+/glutamate symporter
MEGWLYGLFALIGVLFGGLFSYWGIKKQVEHSDKRFKKELERAREESRQKRQWEVRSEPLLKLRTELAVMAVKLEDLAASSQRTHTRFGGTQEEIDK